MGRRCPCGPKHKWCWYECSNIDAWGYYFVDASLPLFSTTSGNNLEKQRIRGKKNKHAAELANTKKWHGKVSSPAVRLPQNPCPSQILDVLRSTNRTVSLFTFRMEKKRFSLTALFFPQWRSDLYLFHFFSTAFTLGLMVMAENKQAINPSPKSKWLKIHCQEWNRYHLKSDGCKATITIK